jgi:hypothetical protein
VERQLVDPEVAAEVREEADERLADGARADDVDDLFHEARIILNRVAAFKPRKQDVAVKPSEIRSIQ